MLKFLALAILIRLLIMPFYFHPDIKTYSYQVSHLKNGVFNIYQYISENKEKLSVRDDFTYFPLTYFFLGTYQIIISPLLGSNFTNWISGASSSSIEEVGVFRYLTLLKSLYLLFDIAIAFLLMKFFDNFEQKKKVFIIWLFNPFSYVLIYVYSGIDILPVLFTVGSLLFLKNKKIILSAFLMGIAASFKGYTLLFLPFMMLMGRNFKVRIQILLALLGSFIIIILPFLFTAGFRDQALISGLSSRLFYTGVSMGFGESLMITVVAIAVMFFWALMNDKELSEYWHYFLALLLCLFSTIHYHIQWLLWILPFLVILAVFSKRLSKLGFIWLILAFSVPLLYDDKSMTVSLLSTISPLYNLLPTPFVVIQKFYDPYTVQSVIHSVMFALSLVLIWQLFKPKKI